MKKELSPTMKAEELRKVLTRMFVRIRITSDRAKEL